MTPGTIYTHDRNQLVVRHEASGYYAIAPRDLVLAAEPDAIRTGFRTSFFRPSITLVFLPRGEARTEPTAPEIRWRDAVVAALAEPDAAPTPTAACLDEIGTVPGTPPTEPETT